MLRSSVLLPACEIAGEVEGPSLLLPADKITGDVETLSFPSRGQNHRGRRDPLSPPSRGRYRLEVKILSSSFRGRNHRGSRDPLSSPSRGQNRRGSGNLIYSFSREKSPGTSRSFIFSVPRVHSLGWYLLLPVGEIAGEVETLSSPSRGRNRRGSRDLIFFFSWAKTPGKSRSFIFSVPRVNSPGTMRPSPSRG